MQPSLTNKDQECRQERPSLPSIRDLFGEHLSKPVNKRPSSFSLEELGFSLPSGSNSPGPAEVPTAITSPRSVWSSGQYHSAHANTELYAPTWRRDSDSGSFRFTTPSTPSNQEDYITLPPINPIYSQSYRGWERSASSSHTMTSSRRTANSLSRSLSTSEAMTIATGNPLRSDGSTDPSFRRRHTIGSSRSSTTTRHQRPNGPSGNFSNTLPHTTTSRSLITNPYPAASTHPSLTRNLLPVVDYPSPPSCPSSSPPSTSGDDVSTERKKKKTPAKYECQYCKKRFNRPSSLKLHHNTHTGEKPFTCPFPGCGRHFSVMSNMRRHARIHGEATIRVPRDGSVDDNFEASTVYLSSSSTHNTPIIPQAAIIPSSDQYSRSHSPSSTSSSHTRSPSRVEILRRSYLDQPPPYPYKRSQSPLSDQGRSSPEW